MEALRPLPDGIHSSHAHIIDTIHLLHERGLTQVRVGDISAARHVTRPNVTKLVNDLAAMGLVEKRRDASDGREVTVDLTERGQELRRIYIGDYHRLIASRMSPLPAEDVRTTIRIIDALYVAVTDFKEQRPTTTTTTTTTTMKDHPLD